MGVVSSSLASHPTSKGSTALISKDPADEITGAPNRDQRAHCWEARDVFFKCLDQNGIIDSITDHDLASRQCGKEAVTFDENCASSWVQYFKRRRVMEHKRNETLEKLKAEGALPLPNSSGGGSRGPPS